MTKYRMFTVLFLLLLLSGCYLPITGRVIDEETQQPIEGAVVLVEWTKTHGFGEYWTESYKVVETLSDNNGNIKIAGCNSPFVNPPDVTVYKAGYVAWNNKRIFPTYDKRTDFEWRNGSVFKLEKFLHSYSYLEHRLFIAPLLSNSDKKPLFENLYYEGEGSQVLKEQRVKDKAQGGPR